MFHMVTVMFYTSLFLGFVLSQLLVCSPPENTDLACSYRKGSEVLFHKNVSKCLPAICRFRYIDCSISGIPKFIIFIFEGKV